jgi:hypothetical protein
MRISRAGGEQCACTAHVASWRGEGGADGNMARSSRNELASSSTFGINDTPCPRQPHRNVSHAVKTMHIEIFLILVLEYNFDIDAGGRAVAGVS